MKKITLSSLLAKKGLQPISMITAYDALFSKLLQEHSDMLLVGDSLNMSFLGKNDTLSATLDQMIYHTNAVCNGAPEAFVVCDMPFGTYMNEEEALANAVRVYQETNADAVKIEGGVEKASIVKHLTTHGILVVGHVGLMPQSVRRDGGYSVKGKDETSKKQIMQDAVAIEKAGASFLVIEGVKADVAKEITSALSIPVIGIGAGVHTDGQVLVWSDMLGFFESFKPKFVKTYLEGGKLVREAVQNYTNDVHAKTFPTEKETYL